MGNKGSILDMDEGLFWRSKRFNDQQRQALKYGDSPEKSHWTSVGDHYLVDMSKCLGNGHFGKVYLGREKLGGERVAVKTGDSKNLVNEYNAFVRLAEARERRRELQTQPRRFIKMLYLDVDFQRRGGSALVVELLGKDLGKLFREQGRRFSSKTTLMIAIQLIECLEQIHSADILHRDLKPENFLIGRKSLGLNSRIFMVDYGLSKVYRTYTGSSKNHHHHHRGKGGERSEEETYEHVEDDSKNHGVRGTIRYISVNAHKGKATSRRDEIESLSYVLIYLANGGSLPWKGLTKNDRQGNGNPDKKKTSHNEIVLEAKENTSIWTLCRGIPRCYRVLLETSKRMAFKERPDYERLQRLFHEELLSRGWTNDSMFDWMSGV